MARKKPSPTSMSLPFGDYQAAEGINWSSLKHLMKSPLHFEHNRKCPPEDRAILMAGRATHTAILEPDRFPLDYAVFTGPRRAGADWEAFKEAHVGRTILKESEYQEALAIRDAVRAHKVAAKLLSKGHAERVITWTDEATGLKCKGRVDYLRPDGLVDLKRTASLDERRFQRTAFDMGYHCQLAFYVRGLKALGMPEPKVWMVAVEGTAPYDVAAFTVDPGVITEGDVKVTELLALFVECQKRKKWPGRYPTETTFFLPGYAYAQEDAGEPADLGLSLGSPGEAA